LQPVVGGVLVRVADRGAHGPQWRRACRNMPLERRPSPRPGLTPLPACHTARPAPCPWLPSCGLVEAEPALSVVALGNELSSLVDLGPGASRHGLMIARAQFRSPGLHRSGPAGARSVPGTIGWIGGVDHTAASQVLQHPLGMVRGHGPVPGGQVLAHHPVGREPEAVGEAFAGQRDDERMGTRVWETWGRSCRVARAPACGPPVIW
jgi:hypothetical protein